MRLRVLLALAALPLGCGDYFSPTQTARRDAAVDASAPLNLCGDGDFTDRSDPSAAREVRFGGSLGMAYSPACIRVAVGQTVRFSGAFGSHPLRPGARVGDAGAPSSPIAPTQTGDRAEFTFTNAGDFPYFCEVHGAMGMMGVVRVR